MKKFILFVVAAVFLISLFITTTVVLADDGSTDPVIVPASEPVAVPDSACTDEQCAVLPATDEKPADGSYKVEVGIPVNGELSAMTGDLTVGTTTFQDVPAVCGDKEDVIYIGANTPFEVCSIADTSCINTIRAEHGAVALTDEETLSYGKSFDDVLEQAVGSGDYTQAVPAFRWMTGNTTTPFSFVLGDDIVSTWLGLPSVNPNGIQSLAFWLGKYCEEDVADPTPPREPRVIVVTGK
jgi:hypothetical protein